MRILFYSDSVEFGGAEKYLKLLAVGLKEKGHNIFVCFTSNAAAKQYLKELRAAQIEIIDLPKEPADFSRIINEKKIEVLHFNLSDAFACKKEIKWLQEIKNVKKIATIHSLSKTANIKVSSSIKGFIALYVPFWDFFDKIRGCMSSLIGRKRISSGLLAFDQVIAVSEASRRELINNFKISPEKIQVIYNGIKVKDYPSKSEARHKLGIPENVQVVACLGRLVKNKGQEVFLKAIRKLKEFNLNIKYLIVGDGYLKTSLEKLAQKLGITNDVLFFDYSMAPLALAAMDISAVPSFSETFSYIVAESMAAGKAVIASKVGGIPELVVDQETGRLVRPDSVEELSNAIRQIINNAELLKVYGIQAKERIIKHFNLKDMIDNSEKIYLRKR